MDHGDEGRQGKGSYRNLDVWKKACDLAEQVYLLTGEFPKAELFGLVKQMKEAAISVPANIAEGCTRHGKAEFLHFLHIAAGSLAETVTFLEIGRRLGFGDTSRYPALEGLAREVGLMLYGLIRAVRDRPARGSRSPTTQPTAPPATEPHVARPLNHSTTQPPNH